MTDAAAPAGERPGPADLIEIFYAPRAVFERRSASGAWFIPYIVLIVVGVAIFFATRNLMQPLMDAQVATAVAKAQANGALNADQIAKVGNITRFIASAALMAYFVIAPFVVAFLVWAAGSVFGISGLGRVALMIAVFSLFPHLVAGIVAGVQAAILPDTALTSLGAVSLSPARFLGASASPGLMSVLLRFDLFTLWGIVLIALGLRYAARATNGQAWGTAIVVWVIGTLSASLAFLHH